MTSPMDDTDALLERIQQTLDEWADLHKQAFTVGNMGNAYYDCARLVERTRKEQQEKREARNT